MNRSRVAMALGVVLLLAPAQAAYAQASRSFVESLRFAPVKPYSADRNLPLLGLSDWALVSHGYARDGGPSDDAAQFAYIRYRSSAGARLQLYPFWNSTSYPVPPGAYSGGRWTDSCSHAHLEYAVIQKRWRFIAPFGPWIPEYVLNSSAGKLGMRQDAAGREVRSEQSPTATCVVTSRPSTLFPFENGVFRWGDEWTTAYFWSDTTYWTEEVFVAGQAATHGWKSHPACFAFQCFPGFAVYAARVQ
jgi:hypothetical protein